MELFGLASGLFSNLDKSVATPIGCSEQPSELVRDTLLCKIEAFPCRYLGIPLSIFKLRKSVEQSLVDAVASRIPQWKGRLLNMAGRTALARVTLSAIPIHMSIALCLSQWAIEQIDRRRRAFIWCGEQTVTAGKCKVAWKSCCKPKDLGGLGVIDLRRARVALRVRWEWKCRVDQSLNWSGLHRKKEKMVTAVLKAATVSIVGSEESTFFWTDNWIDGTSIPSMVPALYQVVAARRRGALVCDALPGNAWVRHITGAHTVQVINEFMFVWQQVWRF